MKINYKLNENKTIKNWTEIPFDAEKPSLEVADDYKIKIGLDKVENGVLVEATQAEVAEYEESIKEANRLTELRHLRQIKCFSVINRGKLWYNRLSAEQEAELLSWYEAWLNVTETGVVLERPEWVDDTLNSEEVL